MEGMVKVQIRIWAHDFDLVTVAARQTISGTKCFDWVSYLHGEHG